MITQIDCKPYRCKLSARSCADRSRRSKVLLPLNARRKGVQYSGPDLRGCVECPVGNYVAKKIDELVAKAAEPAEASTAFTAEPKRWLRPKQTK